MDFPALAISGAKSITGDIDATAANARPESDQSGTANNKGSWVETFASTEMDSFGINVSIGATLSANSDRLVDIGIGAASSEQVIIGNIVTHNLGDIMVRHMFFPLKIPQGSRVAHRSQATSTNQNTLVGISLVGGGFVGHHASCGACQTLGAVTGDSGGTSIDPGGTAGTKGSWVQVPSSTTTSFPGRWLMIGIGNQNNAARAVANWLLDVAIGGSGSEQTIIGDLHLRSEVNQGISPVTIGPIPLAIPQGSQLSARASCSITDATDRLFDIVFYVLG